MIRTIVPLWASIQGGFRVDHIVIRFRGKWKEVKIHANSREGSGY